MHKTLPALVLLSLALLLVPACAPAGSSGSSPNDGARQRPPEPERWLVEVLDRRAHDTAAYTQGLLWRDGVIYESTGSYGASSLRSWRWDDGSELDRVDLDRDLFGEGIALVPENRLVFPDGSELIMSDGTPVLTFRDPETLEVRRRLRVTRNGMPLDDVNELELVDDRLFANLFGSDEIAVIDVEAGSVVAVVDASGLLTAEEAEEADVLNGIAYRPDTGTFLLTGKYWPWVFEVRIPGYDPPPGD